MDQGNCPGALVECRHSTEFPGRVELRALISEAPRPPSDGQGRRGGSLNLEVGRTSS